MKFIIFVIFSFFVLSAYAQEDSKTIYIVKESWHTGMILSKQDANPYLISLDDFADANYLEIGWGDEVYYQAQETTIWMGIKALFWPTSSVINIISYQKDPLLYFSNNQITKLELSKTNFIELVEFINSSFALNEKGEPVKTEKDFYGRSIFYHANGIFHIFNNCNTWSADAIDSSKEPSSD